MSQLRASLNQAIQLHQSGRIRDAISLYYMLLEEQPANAQVLYLLGTANLQIGQHTVCVEQLQRSLVLNPINASACNNLGNALMDLRRLDEALASYDKALALKPDHADTYYNRGIVLQELKRLDEALASYDKALELKPDYADAYNNRGIVLFELTRLHEALASYERALALRSNDFDTYYNRGNALKGLKRLDEALASYEKALELKPNHEYLEGLRLHVRMQLCQWQGFSDSIQDLSSKVLQLRPVTEPGVYLSLVDAPELHLKASIIYADRKYKKQDLLGPIPKRAPDGKIRIGYYSADFRNHAVSFLAAELFELHDRSRFDVYGFSFGGDTDDEMRQRTSAAFDRFIDVRKMSDREVAKLSRELGIDIAVNLGGYTTDSRTGIFAERSAPVQINYLGYIGTMGADYIDYVIADKIVIPKGQQSNFTEKVVYLPHCYQVNDSKRRISDRQFSKLELGLPDNGFVFCCFSNNYKILPASFDGWMRILKAVDGSVLWLLEDNPTAAKNLRNEAKHRGVDANRLVFVKRIPPEEYLARYRVADLFLDTLPYNAGTTASDALWAGIPVLTCMGKSFVSRMAASLLNAIGLPELITTTQEEYEAKAIELAMHQEKMRDIKDKLEHNRLTTPLFDTSMFTKHIETAYEVMYDNHQDGLAPNVIEVTPFCVSRM